MIRHPRIVLLTAVALGLVLACGPVSTGLSPSPTGGNSSSSDSNTEPGSGVPGETGVTDIPLIPNPLNVQVTLDTANAQAGGGGLAIPFELMGQTANGTTFTLLVPEKLVSLDADGSLVPAYGTAMTLTPVSTIEGFPFSRGFLAAVQLTPHGLFMLEPAVLMLTIPGDYDPGELVGFAWDGNGDNFHLYPANILSSGGGQTIVLFDILHVGADGVGVAPATPQEIQDQHAHVPEGEINQDDDLLSPLTPLRFVELDRQRVRIANALLSILSDQLNSGITRGNCNDLDVLSQQFITWHARVIQVAGGSDRYQSPINNIVSSLRIGLDACLKATCSICMGTPPINKQSVDSFLIHAFYAETLANIAGDSGEANKWYDLANQCANNAGRPLPRPVVAYCGPPGTPGCGTAAAPNVCPSP